MAAREARLKDGIEAVAIVTPNHMHWPVARAFLKRGIQPENWGLFIPVSIILIVLSLVRLNPFRHTRIRWLLLPTLVVSLLPIALFYVQSFTYERDLLIEILVRSFDRAFLPAASLIVFVAFLIFGTAFGLVEDNETMKAGNA